MLEKELHATKERFDVMVRKFNGCIDKLKGKIYEERLLKTEVRKFKIEIDTLKFRLQQKNDLVASTLDVDALLKDCKNV